MRVAILDDYCDTLRTLRCFAALARHDVTVFTDHTDDVDELASRLASTEALVLIRERTAIQAPLLERLPDLRLISQRSVYPHIDVAACTRLGIVVSSDLHPGAPSHATAELTWGLILAAARHIPEQAASLRAGRWQTKVGHTLRGRTLGIFGYGRLGAAVARLGEAFGMRVIAWGGEGSRTRAAADDVEVAASKAALFGRADVLSVHLRLVDATRGIVGPEDFAVMQPSSMFVNTSRAGLVVPGALAEALSLGRPGSAAVDVFEREPLFGETDELATMEAALCTPHLGYVTMEEWELQFGEVFAQVSAFDSGTPSNVVNTEVLTSERLRRR
jgi:D-3-phosphoglycerate dehydrogenase